MSKIYAAYGSNIHTTIIGNWAPEAKEVGVGIIKDYALYFRGGLATIEPKKNSIVPVKLYEITNADEAGLDVYEGYAEKLYDKKNLPIEIKAYNENYISRILEPAEAMVYIMDSKYPFSAPQDSYLRSILYGYLHTEERYKLNLFTYDKLMKAAVSR
jgi:gamma-glutamylcyclotransferase (GGCT)/AIG2-like uncharacterized protein YtfP